MSKLIPFSKLTKRDDVPSFMSGTSVITSKDNVPLGFVFGRDSFISLCTTIDSEFEKRVSDPQKAYENPAGKLIDIIEQTLSVNPNFANDMRGSIVDAKKTGWIPLQDIKRSLNV